MQHSKEIDYSGLRATGVVLSGRCNGVPIVSPVMLYLQSLRDEHSTFTGLAILSVTHMSRIWLVSLVLRSRNLIENPVFLFALPSSHGTGIDTVL